MEIKVKGIDISNALTSIKLDPQVGVDNKKLTVVVERNSSLGNPLDLKDAEITITSDNPSVASVGEDGTLTAGTEGKAKINVVAHLNGNRASDYFYIDVDAQGKMHLHSFLKEAKLTLSNSFIKKNEPVIGSLEGRPNTGEQVELNGAALEYM